MFIKVAFLFIIGFALVLLFDQLPAYILGPYSNLLAMAIVAFFGFVIYKSGK